MSWFDRNSKVRLVAAATLLLALPSLVGCQVRPLYAERSAAALSTIGISDAENRLGQVVRNQLIFLFNGGKGEPSQPEYVLNLKVSSSTTAILDKVSSAAPKPGSVQVSAAYELKRGDFVVKKGTRSVDAQIDRSSQQFALIRAVRDAENRAAREIAEFIMMDVSASIQE
jgi:LPS-assembly lipoprotein